MSGAHGDVVAALNERFASHAVIRSLSALEPELHELGALSFEAGIATAAAAIRPTLSVNDGHAVLAEDPPSWTAARVRLRFHTADFATIRALRDAGRRPRIVSASAVLFSKKRRLLHVHLRSAGSDTYPGLLHTYGGAYLPHPARPDGNLLFTLQREVHEESSSTPAAPSRATVTMLSEELTTGFIQCVFLGIDMDLSKRASETYEGRACPIPFDELEDELLWGAWVPSGKLHVLAWLALGAPGLAPSQTFGQRSARGLFEAVMQADWGPFPAATAHPAPHDLRFMFDAKLRARVARELHDLAEWANSDRWNLVEREAGNCSDGLLLDALLRQAASGAVLLPHHGSKGPSTDPRTWHHASRIKEACRLNVINEGSTLHHALEIARARSNVRHAGVPEMPHFAPSCYAAVLELVQHLATRTP